MLEKDGEAQLDCLCKSEEVLHRGKEESNIVQTAKTRTANWTGHSLCANCLLKHVIEGNINGR